MDTDSKDQIDQAVLLAQYDAIVDIFKHHLDLTVKFLGFYFTFTGAIVSYYLAHQQQPLMKVSLLLPILFGLILGGIAFWGAAKQKHWRDELRRIGLELNINVGPHFGIVAALFRFAGATIIFIAIALIVIFFTPLLSCLTA